MVVRCRSILCFLFSFAISTLGFAAQGPQTFTLDGYIKQAGSTTALKDAALKIKIQIMDPTKQCLLYEEEQTVDTVSSGGYFSIQVGSDIGAAKRTADDSGLAMYQVFQNSTAVVAKDVPGQTCTGGTFTPITQDYRYMRVTVTPSGTGVADVLSPDTVMDAVPAAVIAEWAESVGGFTPNDLLQVNAGDNLTQTNLENLFAGTGLTNLQAIAAGNFMPKSSTAGATLPSYATGTPPTTPVAGSMWYDSGTKEVKYYDGSTTQIVGTGGGSVTEVKTTTNLTVDGVAGGTITSSGTLDLNDTGVTASTYPKVTVDAKGRITAGTTLSESDIPTLTSAGNGVDGGAIQTGTIGGNTVIDTTGNIETTGTLTAPTVSSTAMSTRQLDIYDSDNTQYVRLVAPATADLTTSYALTLPTGDGDANQVLTTDGAGILTWTTPITGSTGYVNGGNSFGADATIGLNDAHRLDIETNNQPRITVAADGKMGIGTTAPTFMLELSGTATPADQKIGVNGTQVVYLPDQAVFPGSIFFGSGGANLSSVSPSDGRWNTGVGIGSLANNTTGYDNTAVGYNALKANTTGKSNAGFGMWALYHNSTGVENTGVGASVLAANTTGSNNTAVGANALDSNETGSLNTAIGSRALEDNKSGDGNVAVGGALGNNTTGSYNTAVANSALNQNTTGNRNVAYGQSSLATNTTKNESTAVGYASMNLADNSISGAITYNTAIGAYSLVGGSAFAEDNTGIKNTALGHSALRWVRAGSGNIGVGYNAGSQISSGSYNVVIGSDAGTSIKNLSNNILLNDGEGNRRITIPASGNVGVGTTDPATKLEVAGTVRVGDGGETCAATYAGGIRYNGGNLQFCNGTSWSTLGVAGSGITALTGDVTASGSGSVVATIANDAVTSAKIKDGEVAADDLADDAVTTVKIADDAVTFAKIQDMTTNKLLGRSTAGAGDIEEITLGTGLTLSGGTLDVSDGTDNDALGGLSCAANEVPKWNGSAWICQATASTSTTDALVLRDGAGNFAANNITANGLSVNNGGSLVNINSPVGANYSLTLPTTAGATNQVLATDGAGVLTWTDALTSGSGYVNGGNSFGADASIGLNDTQRLDIETDGSPRVTIAADGKVGIGTTNSPTFFSVKKTETTAGSNPNVLIWNTTPMTYKEYTFSPSSASTSHAVADASYLRVTGANHTGMAVGNAAAASWEGTGANGEVYGFYGQASFNSSGSVAGVAGVNAFATSLGSGAVTSVSGVTASGYNQSSSGGTVSGVAGGTFAAVQQEGTTLELVGVKSRANIVSGQSVGNRAMGIYTSVGNAGTVPVSYGLYIDGVQGTKAYSLFAADATAPSYFAGNVGIGTTNPTSMLSLEKSESPNLTFTETSIQSFDAGTIDFKRTSQDSGRNLGKLNFYSAGGFSSIKAVTDAGANTGSDLVLSTDPVGGSQNEEVVRITSTGRVGIGTSDPSYKLDVDGDINVTGKFKVNGVDIVTGGGGDFKSDGTVAMTGPLRATAGASAAPAYSFATDTTTGLYMPSAGNLNFALAGTGRWFMTTTAFYSTTGTGPAVNVSSGEANFKPRYGVNAGLGQVVNGVISLMTDGQHRMVVDASGNVGIGTTEPTGKLSVVSPDDFGGIQLQSGNSAKFAAFSIGRTSKEGYLGIAAGTDQFVLGAVAGDVILRNNSGKIMLAVNNGATAALTATNTGRVGIGTTSPSAPLEVGYIGGTGGIVVTGSSGSEITALKLVNTATNSGSGASILLNSSSSTTASISGIRGPLSTDGILILKTRNLSDGVAERLRIDQNGNVGIGTTAPSEMLEVAGSVKATSFISTSDRRLKRDIASVDGLDAILRMKGVTWNWKSNGTRDMGVIAQDVEKVFPWAVVTDPNTGFKAVKYNGLIAPLIESTKELYGMCRMADQRNDQQDRSIASLEDKAARLEAENRVKDLKIKTLEQKLDAIQAWVCAKDPSAAICQ